MESEFFNSRRMVCKSEIKAESIVSFCQYGTSKELNEEGLGFPVLRLNEFSLSFISTPQKYCNLINEEEYSGLQLKKDDVLICRTNGNPKLVGKSAIVPRDYDYAFASYLFRVRPDNKYINSATLVAFLNSKYGRMEIEAYSMVGNQANFSPAKFREINVPLLSQSLNKEVEIKTYEAFWQQEQSRALYHKAEEILLNELGLHGFVVSSSACNVKSVRESFLVTGRLDAEYYQPKYEDYGQIVKNYRGGYGLVGELCDICDANFNPNEKTQYRYMELADIGKRGEIMGCSMLLGKDLPSRAKRIVHKDDVIVSSIEGSLSSCALVTNEYEGTLCSTGFYVMRSERLNPETLLMLFKSLPVMEIMRKGCSGTILMAITREELERVPLPLIPLEVQKKIAECVRHSFDLQHNSARLLDESKKLVEDAIESGNIIS